MSLLPRRTSSRAALAVAALALLVAAWWWGRGGGGGPRYLGRSARAWFPRYSWDGRWTEAEARQRWADLTGAGPEIMPMLVAAADESDDASVLRYRSLWRTAPSEVQVWLPEPVTGDEVRREVGQVLRQLVERSELLRAFTNAFASFPVDLKLEVLRNLPPHPATQGIVVPLCVAEVGGTNPAVATTCAASLIEWSVADPAVVPRWLGACLSWPDAWWRTNPAASRVASGLMRLRTNGAAAEPLFRRWLASGTPLQRACAAVTLPAISPALHPLAGTLSGALPGIGLPELALVLPGVRGDPRWGSLDWVAALAVLAPRLDPDRPETVADGAVALPGLGPRGFGHPVLLLARELGTNAVAALPYLPRLARSTNVSVAASAANLLATLGPVAPETVPALVSALTNAVAAPSLVLLLGAYGPAARAAVPVLADFAAGRLPDGLDTLVPGLDGAGRGMRRAGWRLDPAEDVPRVVADLAWRTGRTGEWPLSPELSGRTNLNWRSGSNGPRGMSVELMRRYGLFPTNSPAGEEAVPAVTLAELAAAALHRIEGGQR